MEDKDILILFCSVCMLLYACYITRKLPRFLTYIGSLSIFPVSYFFSQIYSNPKLFQHIEYVEVKYVLTFSAFILVSIFITQMCVYYSTRVLSVYCPSKCNSYRQLSQKEKNKYSHTISNCPKEFKDFDFQLQLIVAGIGVTWLMILVCFFVICINVFNYIKI